MPCVEQAEKHLVEGPRPLPCFSKSVVQSTRPGESSAQRSGLALLHRPRRSGRSGLRPKALQTYQPYPYIKVPPVPSLCRDGGWENGRLGKNWTYHDAAAIRAMDLVPALSSRLYTVFRTSFVQYIELQYNKQLLFCTHFLSIVLGRATALAILTLTLKLL